jgi:hypothetical protein
MRRVIDSPWQQVPVVVRCLLCRSGLPIGREDFGMCRSCVNLTHGNRAISGANDRNSADGPADAYRCAASPPRSDQTLL